MNFSRWDGYSSERRLAFLEEISVMLRGRSMPPARYLFMHPESRLSNVDIAEISQWASTEGERLRALSAVTPTAGSDQISVVCAPNFELVRRNFPSGWRRIVRLDPSLSSSLFHPRQGLIAECERDGRFTVRGAALRRCGRRKVGRYKMSSLYCEPRITIDGPSWRRRAVLANARHRHIDHGIAADRIALSAGLQIPD